MPVICTVTTAKTTLPQMQRFVAGNLANGVDRMFVFLDDDAPEVQDWLEAHAHVTVVRTDDSWWRGERPDGLNARQGINATLVNHLLAELGDADWLFGIDADEILLLDRAALDALPDAQDVVIAEVLEVVAQWDWDGDPVWFKRLLAQPDLELLTLLGIIERAHNRAYFRGHLIGKAGLRPRPDVGLGLHKVLDREGEAVPGATLPGVRVLHYESYSGVEFVRKWAALLRSGQQPGFRQDRRPTSMAIQALLAKDLSQEEAEPYFRRIFENARLDDFETLHELGLLEEHRPLEGTHQPAPWSSDQLARCEKLLARYRDLPKRPFFVRPQGDGRNRPQGGQPARRQAAPSTSSRRRPWRRRG